MNLPPTRKPYLLLVEPDASVRERLFDWLERSGYDVATVPNAHQAIAQLRTRPPEVLLTALHLPSTPAYELLDVIRGGDPLIQVIVQAGDASVDEVIEVLREGRSFDVLLKPLDDPFRLNVAIERALIRRLQLARLLGLKADPPPESPAAAPHEALSKRERLILTYLCQGTDIRVIASQIDLAEKTLRNYLTAIYRKLSVSSRSQAMAYCHRHGIGRSPVPMDA